MQDAHISKELRTLHDSLISIVGVMNRPQRDEAMVKEAGIALDRALFPLLVVIERLGPIGVVELADRIGRDYTTISRQVSKLESLALIQRQGSPTDRRVRESIVTAKGKAMTDAVDIARERVAMRIFADWPKQDFTELVRLMRKFADGLEGAGDSAVMGLHLKNQPCSSDVTGTALRPWKAHYESTT